MSSFVQRPTPQGEGDGQHEHIAQRPAQRWLSLRSMRAGEGRKGGGRTADAPHTSEGGCAGGGPLEETREQASFERPGEWGGAGRKARWVWAQRVLSAELGPAPALAAANICAPQGAHSTPAHRLRVAQEAVCRAQGWAPLTLVCGVLRPEPQTEAGSPGGRGLHIAPPLRSGSSCPERECHKLSPCPHRPEGRDFLLQAEAWEV